MIDYSECTANIRIYEDKKCYQNRDSYIACIHVMWLSKTLVELNCVIGKLSKKSILEVFSTLYDRGALLINCSRCKGKVMPFGKLIQVKEFDSIWQIDLIDLKQRGLI